MTEKPPFAGILRNGIVVENKPWVKRIGYAGKLWPTPMARLGRPRGPQGKRYAQKGRSIELDDAVDYFGPSGAPEGVTARLRPFLWPTPRGADHRAGDELNRSNKRTNGKNLLSAVKMFPLALPDHYWRTGGSLNPEWVEWLMGFNRQWTKEVK